MWAELGHLLDYYSFQVTAGGGHYERATTVQEWQYLLVLIDTKMNGMIVSWIAYRVCGNCSFGR